jgi:hypothetical protein
MSRSLFADLDALIEQAVADATRKEKAVQDMQTAKIQKAGLVAKKKKKKDNDDSEEKRKKDVEEAEDEENKSGDSTEKKSDKGDESIPKISGTGETQQQQSKTIPGTRTSPKLADPPPETIRDPQFPDIEKKVNALRGGGSLRNEKIHGELEKYFSNLTVPERSSFLTFVTGLSQLMAPIKSADQVKDPEDNGLDTRFKKNGKVSVTNKEKGSENEEKEKEEKKSSGSSGVVVVGGD